MFKEDTNKTLTMINEIKELEPVKNLTVNIFIYTKDNAANVTYLQETFNTTNISILRNVGREAGTYFTHILKEWDNLTISKEADTGGDTGGDGGNNQEENSDPQD